MSDPQNLRAYVAELMSAEILPRPPDELWGDMVVRIQTPSRVAEVNEDTYWWFLECLPPKYQCSGLFAFAEGAEPLRIFVNRRGQYLCRPLTWDETHTFCRLAQIAFPYWF